MNKPTPCLIVYCPLDHFLEIKAAVFVLQAASDACRWSCRKFRENVESAKPFPVGPPEYPASGTMVRTTAPTAASVGELIACHRAHRTGATKLYDAEGACVLTYLALATNQIGDAETPLRLASEAIADVPYYRAETYIRDAVIIRGEGFRTIISRDAAKALPQLIKDL